MPEKDGSEDKKSTKSVVNKKQKQFMNQEEQLDLSSVAESFGGEIIGEPVELDEGSKLFTTGARVIKYLKSKPGRKSFKEFGDYIANKFLRRGIKSSSGYTPDPLPIKFKPLKPLKDFISKGTEKAKTQFQKIKDAIKTRRTKSSFKDALNKNQNKNKSKFGTTTKVVGGTGAGLGIGTLIGRQTKKGAGGGFRLGGLPGTAHNVGRRTNPQ